MDAITAIGLVSGIITFVDTGTKLLKLARTLYNSVEGSSKETETRLMLADCMATISKRPIPTHPDPTQTEEDKAIAALVRECNSLSNDMIKQLQSLKPKQRKSKMESSFAALKTLMVEPKIKEMEKQLQSCREQLHFHITALSR